MPRSSARAFVAACLFAFVIATPASGHAALDRASPGPDEVVSVVPTELVARFTQDLHADRTSIELRDAAGQTIASGRKDPDADRVQRLALPVLSPGTYQVRWVTWSAEDDEIERGRYTFTVVEPVTEPSASPGASVCPSPGLDPSPPTVADPSASTDPFPAASTSPAPAATAIATPGISPAPGLSPDPCAAEPPVPSASASPDGTSAGSSPTTSPQP